MKLLVKTLSVVILCVACFVFGQLYSERNYYKSVTEGFIKIPEILISDQSMHVHLLIRTFENYETSPLEAKEELKKFIAMNYTRKERFKGAFGESFGGESDLYQTNEMIEKFLLDNPISYCKEMPKDQMLQCNLDNFLEPE